MHFQEKAEAAGHRFAQAGLVGHRFPVTVVPGEHGPRLVFDRQVNHWLKSGQPPGRV